MFRQGTWRLPIGSRDRLAIADIERQAGISIPVPAGIDQTQPAIAWPADLSAYTKAKKAICTHRATETVSYH